MGIRRRANRVSIVCDGRDCGVEAHFDGRSAEAAFEYAQVDGWTLWRSKGLAYCPFTTLHRCSVCGAGTPNGMPEGVGRWSWYCAEHWPNGHAMPTPER